MNIKETCEKLAMIGLKGNIQTTGHQDYVRIFVIDNAGVSLGRITVFEGKYDHFKWYSGILNAESLEQWKPTVAWDLLLQQNEVLTNKKWNEVKQEASIMREMELQKLIEWRKANPAKIKSNGKRARRRALEGPSHKSCVRKLLNLEGLF